MTTPYRVVITADAKPATDALNSIDSSARRAADSLTLATRVGVGIGVIVPALGGIGRNAIQAADGVTSLTSRLSLVAGSAQAAIGVQEDLFRIAQESRVGFLELGNTYAAVARSAGSMGISQERVLAVTRVIGQAMALSGGNVQSMSAALNQLQQGLASGTLRGEELNSVMEQTPRLAQALAEGLGVGIGQLRAMGAAGELTTDKVITALEKAGPKLARELGQSTVTVGQAFQVLTNSAIRFTGDADRATGATNTLAQAILSLSRGIDGTVTVIRENQGAFQVLTGAAAGAVGLTAVGAALGGIKLAVAGIGAVLAANPIVLALLGIGAAVGVGASVISQRRDEMASLEGKTRELAQLQEQLARNEKIGRGEGQTAGGSLNNALRERIGLLRQEITTAREAAFRTFRAGERDTSPAPGPFPTAGTIEESRKLVKLDLDVKAKYLKDVQTLNESFQQAIFKETDPTKRAGLQTELQRRQVALAKEYQDGLKKLQGPEKKQSEAERYLETLQKQVDTLKTETTVERALAELQSGRLGKVTADTKTAILAAAERVDQEKKLDEAQKQREQRATEQLRKLAQQEEYEFKLEEQRIEERKKAIDTLLGNTTIGRANKLRAQIELLNEEFSNADPSQYEAISQALKELEKDLAEVENRVDLTALRMKEFSFQGAQAIEQAFGQTLYDAARGNFDNIFDMWVDLLLRMAIQAQTTQLFDSLFGGDRKGLTNGLGSIFAKLFGGGSPNFASGIAQQTDIAPGVPAFPSIVRGGADTGTNALQRDMITLVHKGEAIVPEKYNPANGRGGITINNYAGAEVQTRERDDGGLDIDILTRVVEQRMAANVASSRGPMSAALKASGLNRAGALARMG